MSILTGILGQVQSRMPKVITPRAHGYIDYAHSALFFAAGLYFWGRNRRAALAALSTGGFILTEALLTDYPLGVNPVLSFQAHGDIDAGFVPAAASVPRLLGFGDTPEAMFFQANSVAEALVVGLTDYNSGRAREERVTHGMRIAA